MSNNWVITDIIMSYNGAIITIILGNSSYYSILGKTKVIM